MFIITFYHNNLLSFLTLVTSIVIRPFKLIIWVLSLLNSLAGVYQFHQYFQITEFWCYWFLFIALSFSVFLLATPSHEEIPGPRIEPMPWHWGELLQWQSWMLNPLCHQRTSWISPFIHELFRCVLLHFKHLVCFWMSFSYCFLILP